MQAEIRTAIDEASAFIAAHQARDGCWFDFDLPVGTSSEWMTAYVGLALHRADRYADQVDRAAHWLMANRTYEPGWGYNATTGPDADSTAHAMLLLRPRGVCLDAEEAWLRQLKRNSGFATFPRTDGWGQAHPCVTPLVVEAMQTAEIDRAFVRRHVLEHQRTDGTFPTYWWRAHHYSTYHNLRLVQRWGLSPPRALPNPSPDADRGIYSSFDLAFHLGAVALVDGWTTRAKRRAAELLARQNRDGSWPTGSLLRVTDPTCLEPWKEARGALFSDLRRVFTTASVLRVLADLDVPQMDSSCAC